MIENASGGANDDIIRGNNAANILKGNNGNDLLEGLTATTCSTRALAAAPCMAATATTLIAGDGADFIDGGTGFDTADYSRSRPA